MSRALRILGAGLLALTAAAALAVALLIRLLAPASGEWAMPVHAGPLRVEVGVPSALRLLSAPWLAPHLDGYTLPTAHGPVRLAWDAAEQTLLLRCAPCSARLPALGARPLRLERLDLRLRRDFEQLGGRFEAADAGHVLQGRWSGQLSQQDLRLDIEVDDAPIAHWYALFAPGLPELARAAIGGRFGLRAQVTLPSGQLALQPRIAQFTVGGLGTEALLGARSACGAPSRLGADAWAARAVLAAEDQRFFEHPGYDLAELAAALQHNQRPGAHERGGSTLTQQLAKLLVTGDARTIERKMRELLYAVEMERTLGKARILQLYLDNAPWGAGGLCGAEAAARHYFGVKARALTPAQSVQLASMLNAPVRAAERWSREGALDPARTRWVAQGVRGIGPRQRAALVREVGLTAQVAQAVP